MPRKLIADYLRLDSSQCYYNQRSEQDAPFAGSDNCGCQSRALAETATVKNSRHDGLW
jgi:hypothetical protein